MGSHHISRGDRLVRTRRRSFRSEAGQSVVIVALMFAVLCGFAALSVDVGRFYAERRFLQDAVDSAALACARSYVDSGLNAQTAWDAADHILEERNLKGNPLGLAITYAPRGSETYDNNIVAPVNLNSGILPVTSPKVGCRVAVTVAVPTYLIKVVSPSLNTISMTTRAYALSQGGMLPVVVNRYRDPPGPSSTFIDYTKQEAFQNANPNTCSSAAPGVCPDAAFSPLGCTTGCVWGPETVLVGQGYSSSDSDFRGFIALDVRDFTSTNPDGSPAHEYYNGASGLNAQQLKALEASYVAQGGYPGPDLVPYIAGSSPVQKGLQIATMSGNSTGIVVDSFKSHYQLGDLILGQVFDGQVRKIPDFSIDQLSAIPANSPSGPVDGPTFRVGANQTFRSDGNTVTLTMVQDTFNGTSNDTPSQLRTFTFSPNNFTPAGGAGTTVTIKNLQVDSGLASGIYSVIISGTGYTPGGAALATHQIYVPVNIGGVTRDFSLSFSANAVDIAAGDTSATFTASLSTGSGTAAWGTNTVSMAIDQGTCTGGNVAVVASGVQTCVAATVSPASAVPSKTSPPTVTVTFTTTGLPTGSYSAILRSRGTNSAGQPVVHVSPLQINVGTTGGTSTTYVNIEGYVVFMITSTASNTIYARAVSGAYGDPNDANVALGRKVRLVPWETP